MTPIDITPADLETVRSILREEVPDLEVRAFGSRVSWTARETSDLDLVLITEEPLDISHMAKLKESFSESNLPFRVDIVDWANTSENFQKVIEEKYSLIKQKTNQNTRIRSKWYEVKLGDVAELVMGQSPPSSTYNKISDGLPFFQGVKDFSYRYPSPRVFCSKPSRVARPGDILFSVRAPIGRVNVADRECATGRGLAIIKPHIKSDARYLEFLLRHMETSWDVIEGGGSVFGNATKQDLETLLLPWSNNKQKRDLISYNLATLDDKIELNRCINETLEAMARTLFKSWFVDFDPVRAKIEGRWHRGKSLPGLPAHLYDIFPNSLVDSELGQIPNNWGIKTLKDLCHKPQYGYTESARNEPVGPKFLRITDINKKSWIDWRTVPYCKITEKNFDKYRLRKGDIIIARIADPGQGVMIEEDREAVFASYLIRFRPIDRVHARILQYWLRSDKYWELVMERSTGTTRANLNAKVMSGFPLVVPSAPISEAFNKYINSIRTRVVKNALESHSLKTVRDTLLPELISGKLDVKKTKQKGLRT